MFFVIAEPGLLSQSNLVKNGSFETYYPAYGMPPQLPARISGVYSDNPPWYDEVTRCLGDYQTTSYINPRGYPIPAYRSLTKANGGCDGWYNPLDEVETTPDYFHRDTPNIDKDVGVPDNYFNNYGNNTDSHKQYPYDDNENGTVDSTTTEQAYIGILNVRKLSNPSYSSPNYAEYVTQRIEGGLQAQKAYNFKMRVSWTYGIPLAPNNQTGEYLKGIGAYFSESDPFYNRWVNPMPLDINDNAEGLLYDKTYNTQYPTYYNEHGGADGTNWMLVENEIQPSKNMNYITLGNFQLDWNFGNRLGGIQDPPNDIVRIYYFIDAVELTEIPNFVCDCVTPNGNAYTLDIKKKLREPTSNECCFDVFLNVDYEYYVCHVNRAVIKKVDMLPPYNETVVDEFESNGEYFHHLSNPIYIYDNLCYTDAMGLQKKIKVELYNGDELKCTIEKEFDVICDCYCESDQGFSKILFEKDTADCCYNLKVLHLESCDLLIDDISIEVSKINKDGQLVKIVENDFFSYTSLETGWNMNVPFYDISAYKINKSQPKYIAKNAGVVYIGKFCFPDDGNKYNVIISINTQNTHCKSDDFIVQCLPPDIPCCEPISAHVSGNPLWADGDRCCYALLINLPDSLPCVTEDVEIWSEVSNKRLTKISPISGGISHHEFCVDIDDFGENTSLPIQIRFKEQDSASYFCIKLDTLKACEYIPLPCTPDSLNVPWEGPDEADVLFYCPGTNPPQLCYIKFSFVYRLVEDENGDPLHRDVQVIKTEGLSECPCEEEAIKQMLERMWKDINVINNFKLPETLNWPEADTMCFTNFRVITSDCWSQYTVYSMDSLGNPIIKTIRQPCDSVECCYAVYKVCYKKLPDDVIDYLGFERIAQNSQLIQQCNGWDAYPPCLGANCNKWLISGPVQQLIYTDTKKYSGERCNVYVALRKDLTNILNIECDINGSVTLEIVDLMGSTVMNADFIKNSYSYILPLRDNLPSGTYLLRIRINNELLFFSKINIMY